MNKLRQQEYALTQHMTTASSKGHYSPLEAICVYGRWPAGNELAVAIKEAAKRDVERGVRTVVG